MTDRDLKPGNLRSTSLAAQAEASGPYEYDGRDVVNARGDWLVMDVTPALARHIAAWSPDVALAHLDRIASLESALKEACDAADALVAPNAHLLRDTVRCLAALRAKAGTR